MSNLPVVTGCCLPPEEHVNTELVVEAYRDLLPPHGTNVILDIGAGLSTPYADLLKERCAHYITLDIRDGVHIDMVADVSDGDQCLDLADNAATWGWWTEVIEHIPPERQLAAVIEVARVCRNFVVTYPSTRSRHFNTDPGHNVVVVNWRDVASIGFDMTDCSTSSGRVALVFTERRAACATS